MRRALRTLVPQDSFYPPQPSGHSEAAGIMVQRSLTAASTIKADFGIIHMMLVLVTQGMQIQARRPWEGNTQSHEMKSKVQCRPQEVGDAGNVQCLPRKAGVSPRERFCGFQPAQPQGWGCPNPWNSHFTTMSPGCQIGAIGLTVCPAGFWSHFALILVFFCFPF